MELNDAKNRPSEKWKDNDIRDFESNSGILGVASTISPKPGNDQIRFSREDSQQRNTVSPRERSSIGITGEIVRQLIKETERQLAYYKTQTSELETRLQELHQLTENLPQDEKTENSE